MNDTNSNLDLVCEHIDSIKKLLEGNEYETFLNFHIALVQTEINRQLSHYGKKFN